MEFFNLEMGEFVADSAARQARKAERAKKAAVKKAVKHANLTGRPVELEFGDGRVYGYAPLKNK